MWDKCDNSNYCCYIDKIGKVDSKKVKNSLAESGKLFSFSDIVTAHGLGAVFQITNPKNSGKTIKIFEIWYVSQILDEGDMGYPQFIYLYKNPTNTEQLSKVSGGYNMNFGYCDNHVAKFATGELYYNITATKELACYEFKDKIYEQLNINGNIILPSCTNEDQTLLIRVSPIIPTNDEVQARFAPRYSFTIIWSEE